MTGRKIALKNAESLRRWRSFWKPDTEKKEGGRRDYRVYRLSIREWLLYGAEGGAVGALFAYTFYRSFFAFAVMTPVGLLYPLYKKRELKAERLRRLTLQFKEGIVVLSSFLSAGYSLENSLSKCVQELRILYGENAMITEEFRLLAAGVKMNRPVELLLTDFGERSGIEDADNFAQVFAAARRSGGELVEIISHTAGIIRDKTQVQEEIHTMTAARRLEQKIMNAIPFFIVLYIDMTSPGFFHGMYSSAAGRVVMTLCMAAYIGAVVLSGYLLDIQV
jgi:tight adherence protein B